MQMLGLNATLCIQIFLEKDFICESPPHSVFLENSGESETKFNTVKKAIAMTIIIDLNAICVVCLDNKSVLRSIFETEDEMPQLTIADRVSDCSELRFEVDNFRYPDKICLGCLNDLDAAERFKRNCNAAINVFRMIEEQDMDEMKLAESTEISELNEFEQQLKDQKIKIPSGLKIKRVQTGEEEWSNELAEIAEKNGRTTAEPESADENKLEHMNELTEDDGMGYEFYEAEEMEDEEASYIRSVVAVSINNDADAVVIQQPVMKELTEHTDEKKIHPKHNPAEVKVEMESSSDEDYVIDPLQERPKRIGFYGLKNRRGKRTRPEQTLKSDQKQEAKDTPKPTLKPRSQSKPKNDSNATVKSEVSQPKGRPGKICEQCGNVYKFQHALDAHMRRHNNDRPFACEFCDKAFVSNVEMRRHMRVHTGHKPYACQHCNRRFSDYGSRIKHERTHTGERPYRCLKCGKCFAYAHVLTVHLLTHTGEKKFKCTRCIKGFTKKAYLLTHLEQHERNAGCSVTFDETAIADDEEIEIKTAPLEDAYSFSTEYVIDDIDREDSIEPKHEYIINDVDDTMTEEHLEEMEANEYVLGMH